MKKNVFISFLISSVLLFTACETEKTTLIVNDFEDFAIESGSWDNGSAKKGELQDGSYYHAFTTGSVQLLNKYTEGQWGGFWSGFAVSTAVDSVTAGFSNQYSTIAGSGSNGSLKFALAYDSATIRLPYINSYQQPVSVMLTNSTWAYYDIKNGGDFSKKFAAGDWFKVIIRGFFEENQTGTVEFYLADFRDGKSHIVRNWTKVNLKTLGKTDKITFSFASSDVGQWGMNTPAYVCLDDLVVAVDADCDCVK